MMLKVSLGLFLYFIFECLAVGAYFKERRCEQFRSNISIMEEKKVFDVYILELKKKETVK